MNELIKVSTGHAYGFPWTEGDLRSYYDTLSRLSPRKIPFSCDELIAMTTKADKLRQETTPERPRAEVKKMLTKDLMVDFKPKPDSLWLVVVECRYNVISVSPCGQCFFIPGQDPCWMLDHVAEWIEEIIPPEDDE